MGLSDGSHSFISLIFIILKFNPDTMKVYRVLIAFLFFTIFGGTSSAQEKFTAEFRPGLSFPLDKMGGAKINTGYGFEFTLAYDVIPHVGIYAGWGWKKFDADNAFLTNRVDIEETGYTAGIQYIHHNETFLSYLIKGGLVYNHLELEDNSGELIADSGHGIGWQAEAGVSLEIGSNWHLRPTIRYRNLPGDIEVFNGRMAVDLQYISLGVGLAKKF